MLKHRDNTPPHLLLDDTPYFITGAIYDKRRLLDEKLKWCLAAIMQKVFDKFGWELHHWVVLDNNHYHLLGMSRKGEDLPKIIRQLHAGSAGEIHQATDCSLPVWWNYWDYCPRNERDYMVRLNYLLNNPVKHGYVDDLRDYPFSTFAELYEEKGRDGLVEQFKSFPNYKTLKIEADDF
ncbi:MAG: hypothetical protein GY862_29010 [Gammaproteobacteria bacterium]|nr:hypothetical protein [Gammaproteobacteria bacterium]